MKPTLDTVKTCFAPLVRTWHWLACEPHHLVGRTVLQKVFGLVLLFRVFTEGPFSRFLWGPCGVGHGSTSGIFGPAFGSAFDQIFLTDAGTVLVVAALGFGGLVLLIGHGTRLAAGISLLALILLEQRLPELTDGGDNVLRLMLLYMVFLLPPGQRVSRNGIAVWLHNVAVLAIISQLVIVYITSGFMKATGSLWQHGTAMYFISQVDWFSHPAMREMFKDPIIVTASTYGPMMFQLWFPIALFSRFKLLWILLGITLHLGIAALMGLITFSGVMIGLELFLISDEEHGAIRGFVKKQVSRARYALSSPREGQTPIIVFIDGFCSQCRKVGRMIRTLDRGRRVDLVSFRHSELYRRHGIALDALERRMHVIDTRSGEVLQGFGAVRVLVRELHVLWPLRPMCAVLDRVGVGDRLYDAVAVRRRIIPTLTSCDGSCTARSDLADR